MEGTKIKRKRFRVEELIFYCLLLAWPVAQFCVFYIGVNAQSIMLSFMKYEFDKVNLTYSYSWAGFANFLELFETFKINPDFPGMLKNSFITFAIGLIIGTPSNFIISYYLFRNMWELTDMFNNLMVLPNVIALACLSGIVAKAAKSNKRLK